MNGYTCPVSGRLHFDWDQTVGAVETLRVPFVLPDVDEDTIIVSPVVLKSDNGPRREATASVEVIAEEEE